MNAIMLSAGLGTRFHPHTERIAKPAIPFLNVPLLGYSLYHLEKLGLQNLVLNTHHLPQTIEDAANCLTHDQTYKVSFSHEPQILGSGGGIRQAAKFLGCSNGSAAGATASASATTADDFIVCNADYVLLFNHSHGLTPFVDFHKSNGALATLLTTENSEAGKTLGGVWADADGKISKLGGQGTEPNARHFTGIYIFSPRIFDYMPKDGEFHIFKDCLHKAMAAGESVLSFHDPDLTWLDMSSEKDYIASTLVALKILSSTNNAATAPSAEASAASTYSRIKTENLKNILNRFHQNFENVSSKQWLCSGAKFSGQLDPSSFLFMGPDSEIGRDVLVKGFAVLGAGAKVNQGVIDLSVIGPGIHLNPITSLRNEIIV